MKIKVEITSSHDFTIDISDIELDEVVRKYDGDFEEWAKHNYTEYCDLSDMEIEFDGCSFDGDEAEKLLEKSRETIGSSDTNLLGVSINRTKLRNSMLYHLPDEEGLKSFEVSKELLEKLTIALPYVDSSNPKVELNYIHIKHDIAEATDGKRLIRLDNLTERYPEILFPSYFVEPLKNGAKCFIDENNKPFLKYENNWFEGLTGRYYEDNPPKYVDTDRILLEDINHKDVSTIPFKELKYRRVRINCRVEAVEIEFANNISPMYINEIYFNDVVENMDIEYLRARKNGVLHIFGKDFQIAIMSITVDDDTSIVEIEDE